MVRKRDGLVPIGEVVADLPGPVQALREADPDRGFMARLMALCSLPRTNPGNRIRYKRVNGPYTLYMTAGGGNKLPYGNLPRLMLAWISTEAVKTQSRVLVLGNSLSGFMRELGIYNSSGGRGGVQTRLRNQMRRLFNAHVQLVYKDERGEASVSSSVADSTAFWWNPKRPDEQMLWESKIELGEKFFNELINHPVPIDMNTLAGLKRCAPGPRSLPVAHLPDVHAPRPAAAHLAAPIPSVRSAPLQSQRPSHRSKLPQSSSAGVEEDQAGLAGVELRDGSGRPNPASLNSRDRTAQSGV